VSIQPWYYYCLSLKVLGVGEEVHDFCCKVLDRQGDSAGCVRLGDKECMHPIKCGVLRGDGAGAFTIYAVHTCHLWEDLELGKHNFC